MYDNAQYDDTHLYGMDDYGVMKGVARRETWNPYLVTEGFIGSNSANAPKKGMRPTKWMVAAEGILSKETMG